tara:strand:+ start:269 stop:499 length:231 start_codon:yes stop_codon:yes gene_type:complete
MLSDKKISALVDENLVYLEALAEFDRTGVLRRVAQKERVNFTIDINLMRRFRDYCQKENRKMSSVIEKLIKEEIKA